jgi:hypothetical protein
MIGVLGRLSCLATCVSQPSFTTSPDSATLTDWDSESSRGPSWIVGGAGPYQLAAPVGGRYLVALDVEVNATDVMNVPVEAGFSALFVGTSGGVLLGMHSPAWGVDDTNGTTWVRMSAVGIVELDAGSPIEVLLSAHDSDPALVGLGIHVVNLSLVRI